MAKGQEKSDPALSFYPLFYQLSHKICNLFKIPSELSAGAVYVPSHLPAQSGIDARLLQLFLKHPDRLLAGRYIPPLFHLSSEV